MTPPLTTVFGKVPQHGDFLAPTGDSLAPRRLERWLHDGMALLLQRQARSWHPEYDRAAPTRFLYWDHASSELFAGTMFASRDRVDRRHPCVVGASFASRGSRAPWPNLPLGFSDLLDGLDLLDPAEFGGDLETLRQAYARLTWPDLAEAQAADVSSSFLRRSADDLWRHLSGFQIPQRRAHGLLELFVAFRERFPGRFVTRVRSPGDPVAIGFWLSVLQTLLPMGKAPTLLAWGPLPGTSSQSLRLLCDDLQPRYLAAILIPELGDEKAFELDHGSAPSPQRIAQADRMFTDAAAAGNSWQQVLDGLRRSLTVHTR